VEQAEVPAEPSVPEKVAESVKGVIVPTKIETKKPDGKTLIKGASVLAVVSALLFVLKPFIAPVAGPISAQLAYEIAHCTASKAKLFGFIGACCNWFLGLSAVYDALKLGPEVVSLPQTLVMLSYSIIFCRWAGWAVMPRNFMLAGSHMLNIAAQGNQLRRVLAYKLGMEGGKAEVQALGVKVAGALAAVVAFITAAPFLKALMPAGSYLASNGGPFTIHPWPPVTKFFLSLTSLTDLQKPVEKISLAQYGALTLTGFIFSFYGLFVTPINYVLTAVNILLFGSSAWHLGRKMNSCFFAGECELDPEAPKPGTQ
jgi:hypothetical protein